MNINQDIENQRIHRNMTKTQIKVANSVKEGVILNSNLPLRDSYNSMIIADRVDLPNKLYEANTKKDKTLLPIFASTVGFMGVLAGATHLIAKASKDIVNVELPKKLPSLTRNVCINKEMDQAIYRMISNPSKKTALAFGGLAVFSSMAFMGKTFAEGFKEVWVKKKESDIHKNLQENLIEVETQSFSGKMQIIRNMLSEKASEFNSAIADNKGSKGFSSKNISFKGENKENKKSSGFLNSIGAFLLGAVATVSIVGLGYLSMKNIRSSDKSLKTGLKKVQEVISEIAEGTNNHSKEELGEENYKSSLKKDREKISNLFVDIFADSPFVKSTANKMKWESEEEKEEFIKKNLFNISKSTEKANPAMGGSGQDKNTFYSHVSDYKAFLYNWLIDTDNKQFKTLFFGITGATSTAYLGQMGIGAYKDVQVKKYNANTELNLQKSLVSTELRNFKSKKDASINPLCDEFYRKKDEGASKEDLKVVADSILNEIKNGAPYVYA